MFGVLVQKVSIVQYVQKVTFLFSNKPIELIELFKPFEQFVIVFHCSYASAHPGLFSSRCFS